MRKIKGAQVPSQIKSKVYSTSAGISISTALSFLVMQNSTEIIAYVKSVYSVVAWLSAFLSIIFYVLDWEDRKKLSNDLNEVLTDMTEIQSTFEE